jgi:hypothetical protein
VGRNIISEMSKFGSFLGRVTIIHAVKFVLDVCLEESISIYGEELDFYFKVLERWKVNSFRFHIFPKKACHIVDSHYNVALWSNSSWTLEDIKFKNC